MRLDDEEDRRVVVACTSRSIWADQRGRAGVSNDEEVALRRGPLGGLAISDISPLDDDAAAAAAEGTRSNSSSAGRVVKPPNSLACQYSCSVSRKRTRVVGDGLRIDKPGEDMNESTSNDWANERCDREREGEAGRLDTGFGGWKVALPEGARSLSAKITGSVFLAARSLSDAPACS